MDIPETVANAQPILYIFAVITFGLVITFLGALKYIVDKFIGTLKDLSAEISSQSEKQAEKDTAILSMLEKIVGMLRGIDARIPDSRRRGI